MGTNQIQAYVSLHYAMFTLFTVSLKVDGVIVRKLEEATPCMIKLRREALREWIEWQKELGIPKPVVVRLTVIGRSSLLSTHPQPPRMPTQYIW